VFSVVIGALDEMGCAVVIDRMNNARWRRADFPMIGRLLTCIGICNCLSGLAGTLTVGCSSANLGLAHTTGVAARRAGVVTGFLLIIVAFLPKIAMLIILLPAAVAGAIMIYTASYMMVAGAELILSRLLSARRRATVGLSLAAGMAVMLVPELPASMPLALRPLLASGIIMGVSLAIVLNLIFRIGISRRGGIRLDGADPAKQAARFLEERGEEWGARREIIARAALAAGEALEGLHGAGLIDGPARLSAVFNEYRLMLALDYPGRAWRSDQTPVADWNAMLENDIDDAALDDAMTAVSSGIIRHLADRVVSREHNGQGHLGLIFDH